MTATSLVHALQISHKSTLPYLADKDALRAAWECLSVNLQIVDIPGPEGSERIIGGVLHGIVRRRPSPDR